MKSLNLLLFATIFLFAKCSALGINARIIGGIETTLYQMPWQVSLVKGFERYDVLCGGSIIGTNWILTAAHCTYGYPISIFTVRVGSSHWAYGGKTVQIKRKIEHEKYNKLALADFDFTLLELAEPLQFTDAVQPIALPNYHTLVHVRDVCLISGWGQMENTGPSADILRATNISIFDHKVCKQQYALSITNSMICAGTEIGEKGLCFGDSGGPLSCKFNDIPVLIGVSSKTIGGAGDKCGHTGISSIFANVLHARHWIRTLTGI
ncbi:trypsin-7-like [Contarinia nasturtii]|uniref:trypsin-7-like n=1 Tax=Contarinia nasturtii TaxID=265458 RepID=UPI0012D4874D|nr:trypsin-7-like [Contarinia nasturtii]